MGWYIFSGDPCPKCKSENYTVWDRPGECKLSACCDCGLFVNARTGYIVKSSFIANELIGKKVEDLDISDLHFDEEDKRNQDVYEKGSEW